MLVWLPESLSAIYIFNDRHLTVLVSDEAHHTLYDEIEVIQPSSPWLNQQSFESQIAIHFYRSSCQCNSSVNKHLNAIRKKDNIELTTLDLKSVMLPFSLLAIPALLVVGEKSKLPRYFGAYGSGQLGQPEGNSRCAKLINQCERPPVFLNTISQGCFCNESTDGNHA